MEKRVKRIKRKKSKYEYMLDNAGEIQHCMNVMQNCSYLYDDGKRGYMVAVTEDSEGEETHWYVSKKALIFTAKGRKLRSALKSPMGRYYGHKYLKRKQLY